MVSEYTDRASLAPLLLRLALGVILISHGIVKVLPPNDLGTSWAANAWEKQAQVPEGVLEKVGEIKVEGLSDEQRRLVQDKLKVAYQRESFLPDAIRTPAAQMAVAWGELIGGIALLLGGLTRLAALGVIIIQVGAIFTVTAQRGFFATGGGAEYNVALVAMCLALIVMGAGALSVDHCVRQYRARKQQSAASPQQVAGAPS